MLDQPRKDTPTANVSSTSASMSSPAPRSRIRAARCYALRPRVARPWHVVACTDPDGEQRMVPWHRSLAVAGTHAEPLAALLVPERAWDLDAGERAYVAGELHVWPRPTLAPTVTWYTGRARVEPVALRAGELSRGTVGDLVAALAEIDDAAPDVADVDAFLCERGTWEW